MSTIFPASIASAYFKMLSPEQTVERYLEAGFTHAELCHEHLSDLICRADETGKTPYAVGVELRSFIDDKGFFIPQGHLSFRPGAQGGILTEGLLDRIKRELELFHGLGVKNAVLHLSAYSELSDEERHQKVLPVLAELSDFVKGTDICLCIENLYKNADVFTVEQIFRYMDEVSADNLGICLDTGHLHLVNALGLAKQSQREFILKAGDKLKALHIDNNDGVRDQHLLPFNNNHSIHWDEVVQALVDAGYRGIFNLEIGGEHSSVTCPFRVRLMKLSYIRNLMDYMLSEEFLAWEGNENK
ncbi:MAG: sugar phosphate isomerase/epimerase [Clostridia bacterium]|nr:sugar phosphate isomerase/epimerase [Clostridia bacterium]